MDYGLGQGLAFQVDYNDKINQLHRNEQLDLRARNDAEARAAMFASETEYQNAMNEHDAPIIKEHARSVIKKMGEYRRNNPDLLYNPDKLVQFNALKKELKDNPELIRGVSSDKNYSEFVKDLQEVAKNPQTYDTEAYQDVKKQWDNYIKFGNQNGQDAALSEGKKAFLYTKPQPFVADLAGSLLKIGDGIKDYNVVRGKNIGEWWSEPKPGQVEAARQSAYAQHKRQIEVYAKKNGLTTQEAVDKWVDDNIAAGIKKNYNVGDANALWERNYKMMQLGLEKEKIDNKKGGPSYTPFDNFVDPKNKAGNIPVDLARKIWNDKPNMTLTGLDGTKVDLTGLDLNYDGRFVKNKDNLPFLLGNVKVPLAVAIQKGIVKEKGTFQDDDANDAYSVTDINSPFLGQASIKTDVNKDGQEYQYVNVNYHLPVNPNDVTARQMYNVQADVDKLVPASQNPYGESKRSAPAGAGVDEKGNVFDSSGKYLGPISSFR